MIGKDRKESADWQDDHYRSREGSEVQTWQGSEGCC